jgi:tRNA modification GTPase
MTITQPARDATTATLVTAPARGGIAVIVLAGPRTREIIGAVFRPRPSSATVGAGAEAGRLALGEIVRGAEVLDEAVVTLVESDPARSLAEINIHGGPHVARRVLALLAEHGATVAAAPIDETFLAAEADDNPAIAREMLAALPLCTTALAASAITAQWSGGLSALARAAMTCLPSGNAGAKDMAGESRSRSYARHSRDFRQAAAALPRMRRLLQPAEVVVAGPPNVGKSSLVNALIGRPVSIVSPTPGTTRDWVRELAQADGVPIFLTDTAGVWEDSVTDIDAQAVARAWQRVASADVVLCVTAGDVAGHDDLVGRIRRQANVLNVANKCDLAEPRGPADVRLSAHTLAGIAELRQAIADRLGFANFDPQAPMAFTGRQGNLLLSAADAIDQADPAAARQALSELLSGGG